MRGVPRRAWRRLQGWTGTCGAADRCSWLRRPAWVSAGRCCQLAPCSGPRSRLPCPPPGCWRPSHCTGTVVDCQTHLLAAATRSLCSCDLLTGSPIMSPKHMLDLMRVSELGKMSCPASCHDIQLPLHRQVHPHAARQGTLSDAHLCHPHS